MPFLIRIPAVTDNPQPVIRVLARLLGPNEVPRARALVERGGVVMRGLDRAAARRAVQLLEQAGAEAVMEEEGDRPGGGLAVAVRGMRTGRPLAGVEVALVAAEEPDEPLDSGTTDRRGRVPMTSFAAAVRERFPDGRPTVRALATRQGGEVETHHKAFNWRAFEAGGYTFHVEAGVPQAETGAYGVRGRVALPDGGPAAGYRVCAEDRDLRGSAPLGEDVTDQDGRYGVRYDPADAGEDEAGGADLRLRVFTAAGRELPARIDGREVPRIAGEEVLFNAGEEEEVDLAITADPHTSRPSLYERVVADLSPLPDDVGLADLSDADVRFLHHDTGRALDHIAFVRDDARLAPRDQLPRAVFFGWAIQEVGASETDAGLPRIDRDAAIERPAEALVEAFDEAVDGGIVPGALADRRDQVQGRIESLQRSGEASGTAEGLSALRFLAARPLADPEVEGSPAAELARSRAVAAVRDGLDRAFLTAPVEVRDAVADLELRQLDVDADLRTTVIRALRHTGLSGDAIQEAQVHLGASRLPRTVGDVLQPDLPLARNPLVTSDLRQAGMLHVASMAGVGTGRVLGILQREGGVNSFSEDALGRLVEDGDLEVDEARSIGFAADLQRLVDDDDVAEAVAAAEFEALGGRRAASTLDLARLPAEELERVVTEAVSNGDGDGAETSAALLARRLAARFEYLHPDEAVFTRAAPSADASVAETVGRVDRLLSTAEGNFFDPAFQLPEDAVEEFGDDARTIRGLANTFEPLGIKEVLQDLDLSADAKAEEVDRRLGQFQAVREANPDTDLLALDLTPQGDADTLEWGDIPDEDRGPILDTLKTFQLTYALGRSALLTTVLLGSGYHSALDIASTSFDHFRADTGFDLAEARAIYDRARGTIGSVTSLFGSVLDILKGGFGDILVGNLGPSLEDFLKELDGYEDLFGSLDFCDCEHCQSILSPAAYFVDLMLFIEEHVLNDYFEGGDSDDILNLKVRRSDLWTLELTCQNTNELIPTLTIVDEVLENYIATRRGFEGSLEVGPDVDRGEVEDFVYRQQLAATTSSFRQPFLRPLREVELYLKHFERTRSDVAEALGADAPVRTRARLGLSLSDYDLITTPDTGTAFLERIYGLDFDINGTAVAAFDAQELLGPTGLSRIELGDVVGTNFVNSGSGSDVEIRAEKRDDESVQNDVERIHNLTVGALDRIHRFVRLWRAVPWSIAELDLVVGTLADAGLGSGLDADILRHTAALRVIQERFGVSVEEAIPLWTAIPARSGEDDARPLFERLFNPVGFTSGGDTYPLPGEEFVHPAWQMGSETSHLNRLVAGLRVSEEQLYSLIVHLAGPLGVDLESGDPADQGVELTAGHLALLYRHARLAELLDLKVPELFQLLSFLDTLPDGHVVGFADLEALLDGYDRWTDSAYTLDQLGGITGGVVLDDEAQPAPADVAAVLVEAADRDGALTFADTVFAYLEDVSEADSRAILDANPDATESVSGADLLRLADGFDTSAALTIPVGVSADEGDVRAVLSAYHVSEVLPSYLAAELGPSVEKTRALLDFLGADLHGADVAAALRGDDVGPLTDLIEAVYPLHLLFQPGELTEDDVDFAAANADLFAIADPVTLTSQAAWRVAAYHRVLDDRPDSYSGDDPQSDYRADLQAVLQDHDPASGFDGADGATLAALFGAEEGLVSTFSVLDVSIPAVHALERLRDAVTLAQYLGVGGSALQQIVADDYATLALARDAVRGAIRAKYSDEQTWLETIGPFEDRTLMLRRDALVDYLLHAVHPEFDETSDLYHHFLIDVLVDSCTRTSRVVEATQSLQLYVHRCLMNLEQDRRDADDPDLTHVLPQSIPTDEWSWRKNYRVWEANRKVFLYPETYIEPELRDNKTPLFEELEATLLQQEVDEQTVLDAYARYVRGFEEVANLRIAGAYHDEGSDTDVLHLFGTTSDDPPQYYYRTIENLIQSEGDSNRGVVYGPWRKIDVQIPARHASPVVFRGTLYLFWVEIASRSVTDFKDGSSRFVGYRHIFNLRYTARRLDGTWTAPQTLRTSGAPFDSGDNILNDPLFGDEDEDVPGFVDRIRAALTPRYDDEPHYESQDDYTLTGVRWEQVFPDVHETGDRLYLSGVGYQLHNAVDFYANALKPRAGSFHNGAVLWSGGIERGKLVTTRHHSDHWDLYLSTPDRHRLDDYAYASLVADSRRIDAASLNWTGTLESDIRGDLYARYLSRMPEPLDVTVVNGAVSDAFVDLDGDLLYVQGSARDGERVLVRRMGTTLAEDVGRTLVTGGVAGLLDLDAQRAFQEASSPLYDVGSRLDDAVNAGELDFTGPYGTYYREMFFHVPFLIADHLNSQQQFAEAQKWYHYLFDPTAPVEDGVGDETDEDAVRDRPWRYLEFRGLDAQRLRGLLTDPATIEVYEKDPFNPHAIARLRFSAYQKAIVMKYIDNLLDWGDALFTRDTRESITEATLLYMMAADILGDRPAELGDCGEGKLSPKSYERIRPLIEADSPFLIELERYVISVTRRYNMSVKSKGAFTLGTAATGDAVKVADRYFAATYQPEPMMMRAALPTGDGLATDASLITVEADIIESEARASAVVAAESGTALPAKTVYRSDWKRTGASTWVAPGTRASGAGGATAAAGGASIADLGASLGKASVVATHIRPDLLDDFRLPSFGISLTRQVSPVFCVPQNDELAGYWDRVEDRLYKIRHCMNISGVRRQLALFAPPIDPRLLVRARAAGLSLEDALGLTAGELPPYRFAALIGRAKAYAQTVQSFGASLLSALQSKDAEELARLRLVHQENVAKLTTKVREYEIDVATETLTNLEKRKTAVEYRRDYFRGLVDAGRTGWEVTQSSARHTSGILKGGAGILDTVAGIAHLVPQIGAPTAMKWGGVELGESADNWAGVMRDAASVADAVAASAGLEAGFERRQQGWEHQVQLAEHELEQIEPQIEAASIRWEIAAQQLAVHERSIEQTQEVFEFYGDKFTGLGLFTWLSSTLQGLYRDAYNSALAMARLAEQAFRFERRDLSDVVLSPGHWESGRAGLLAGEKLLLELQRMERRFIETDDRRLEIDQSFSLQQIDPSALIQLKETGSCTFTLPERYFDLFYPGHYRRTLKAVRLTIPCVTGPYTNVSATLNLQSSEVRLDPDPAAGTTPSPASRTTQVATSTAQNDAGVFELNFRGERYLPFEGAGAVNSVWQLSLPATFRPFDYNSINDVILRISYAAEYDGTLRTHIETEDAAVAGTLTQLLKDDGFARAIRLRQEFSNTFHRLLQAAVDESVPFEITEQHFPLFLRGRDLVVKRALLAVQPADDVGVGGLELEVNGTSLSGFAALPELGSLPCVDMAAAFAGDPRGTHTVQVANSGDLAPEGGAPPALDPEKVEDLILYIEYGLDV